MCPSPLSGAWDGLGPAGELLDQAAGDGRGDQGVTGGDGPDRGQDLLQRHVLDQEAAGSGAQRGVDVLVVVEGGQHDHAGPGLRGLRVGAGHPPAARVSADAFDVAVGGPVAGSPLHGDLCRSSRLWEKRLSRLCSGSRALCEAGDGERYGFCHGQAWIRALRRRRA